MNELHTQTGAYELPPDLTMPTMEALLAAAGAGWTLSRVLGLWAAERRQGSALRYVLSRTAGGLVTKILLADAADFGWPHAGPVCFQDWATDADRAAGYVTTPAGPCHP